MIKTRDKYPNLIFLVLFDLCINSAFSLIFLFLVVVSGISVVIITYQTRALIMFHEKIVLEKEALEAENRHLMLEEKVLFDLARVEFFATTEFNMKYVDFNEENIIYLYH